jgi:hypothetical protein
MLLWAAAGVIAACGVVGVWKVSRGPAVDPRVVAAARRVEDARRVPQFPPPPRIPDGRLDRWDTVTGGVRPAADDAVPPPPIKFGFLETKREIQTVRVLPGFTYAVTADLDGAILTWALQEPKDKAGLYEKLVRSEPSAVVIERRTPGMEFAELLRLGPEATSYRDASAEPLATYYYRVRLAGIQTDRLDDYKDKPVTVGGEEAVEVRVPSVHRLRLLGGDRTLALLRVETYHRESRKWVSRDVPAAPGKAVPGTAWTLEALRFDKSTLVAEVRDDTGGKRELTTKP